MTHMDRESELKLVAGLRENDAAAFDAVYDTFHGALFNFLARLTRRREVAEDLVEETWLRVVRHAPRLRPDTELKPWLFTIAHNLSVSYRRSRLLEDSQRHGFIGLWPCGTPPPSPFEKTSASETERRLESALAALPVAYREALLLIAIGQLSSAEAAHVCGVSAETMRQRVRRARLLLAGELEERGLPRFAALQAVKS
jgi:RNA polymerase sigma-70 factor (ECF subfamily)